MTLPYFCDYSPLKRTWTFIWIYLNSNHAKKSLFQVWLKLAWCFILKDSFQYTNVEIVPPLMYPTLTFRDHNLYKLKSALSQKAFIKIWVILAQWFSRKNFFNDLAKFLHFCYYLPFEEDLALYWYNLKFPLP
jgi:hypothetical protein